MRLVYLCTDRGVPIGGTKGASIHVAAMVQELRRLGHEVPVVASRFERAPETMGGRLVGFDRDLKALRRWIAQDGDRVLAREAYALWTDQTVLDALERLDAEKPIDGIYERLGLWSVAGQRFCRRRGIPLVLEVNAPLVDEQNRYRELRLGPLARQIERWRLHQADAVIVPSRRLNRWVRDSGRVGPVETLVNGVDLELFAAPQPPDDPRFSRLDGAFVVAFVASLKAWHGVAELLEAFALLIERLPTAHLLVIGDGPRASDVEAAAERWGPDRITWLGALPHEEIPAWLTGADVGVAPYPQLDDFYFSPLKVVEYLAAGLPVVASDLGQLREVVDPDVGRLVCPGSVPELADALETLYEQPTERRRLATSARARAFERHGWAAVATRVEQLFRPKGAPEGDAEHGGLKAVGVAE